MLYIKLHDILGRTCEHINVYFTWQCAIHNLYASNRANYKEKRRKGGKKSDFNKIRNGKYVGKKWNKERKTMTEINQDFYMEFYTVMAQLSMMPKGDAEM